MTYKESFKPLFRRTGRYRIISVGLKYAKFVHKDIENTVSFNGLTRVPEEKRPEIEPTSDPIPHSNTNPASEVSTQD